MGHERARQRQLSIPEQRHQRLPGTGTNTSFDPFIVLTHQASPEKIRINQSTTLTGDMSKDNHGNGAGGWKPEPELLDCRSRLLPGRLGSIPQAQPETLNASAQATATFNAGGTSGRANPTATVDQGTALALDSLISAATEAGTTATITTVGAHGFSTGETVVISGVGVANYNGTFIITATPTVNTFNYTAPAGLGASSGGTANVGIVILEPPQITKSFGAASIPVNGTTTVSFSINNPNVVAINESFTDTLPLGLQVAASPGVVNTCGGTVTAGAGSGSISFSNNLTPVGLCTISVNITGTVDNNYTNSVQILSTDAGNGNTSSANITVINPPTIAKAFGAATIPLNGTTSLTFTLSSTNANLTINGVAFTDNLPAGLVVATPNGLTSTCSGTATAVAGSSSVSLSGATLAPAASCTISVNVTGTTAGVKNNSVQVTSTNAGTGNTSNASITVVAPPTIAKVFGAASIPLNGSTSLSFTITNPNTTVALTGVGFSDTLPAGPGGFHTERPYGHMRRWHNHSHGGNKHDQPERWNHCRERKLHILSQRDGHFCWSADQHNGQRNFNRRRHRRHGHSQHQCGSASVDRQGLQSFNDRAECHHIADVHDYESGGKHGSADRRSLYRHAADRT